MQKGLTNKNTVVSCISPMQFGCQTLEEVIIDQKICHKKMPCDAFTILWASLCFFKVPYASPREILWDSAKMNKMNKAKLTGNLLAGWCDLEPIYSLRVSESSRGIEQKRWGISFSARDSDYIVISYCSQA